MSADPNRVPWGNMYEFTISGTFVVALIYLVFNRGRARLDGAVGRRGRRLAADGRGDLALRPGRPAARRPRLALAGHPRRLWIIATGGFTVGGLPPVVYLVKHRRGDQGAILSRVPTPTALDRAAYLVHAFAFPVWTFAVLITGPIWAHQAWSSYWNWDPGGGRGLHHLGDVRPTSARATAGWKGRDAALLALLGLATLWFNFIGINYFSTNSQHSYAQAAPAPVVQRH